jgi:hypothetical protein
MSLGYFSITNFQAYSHGQQRGAYITVEFTPSAETAGAKVGLFQICRPRKKLNNRSIWEAFTSHGGTGLTRAENGFFIDNEGRNSPLYKMHQSQDVAHNARFLFSSATPNYQGDARIGQHGGHSAYLMDRPTRTVTNDIHMVIQDFETVAFALNNGDNDAVYAGKVLGAFSWGYLVEANRDVRLLGPTIVAKARPEVKTLCGLWNAAQNVQIPNVANMQCRNAPPDPVPPPQPERGRLRPRAPRVVVVAVPSVAAAAPAASTASATPAQPPNPSSTSK